MFFDIWFYFLFCQIFRYILWCICWSFKINLKQIGWGISMWFEGCKLGRLHLIFVFLLSLLQALSSNGLSMGFRGLVLLMQVTDHVLKDEIAMETSGAQRMWWNNHVALCRHRTKQILRRIQLVVEYKPNQPNSVPLRLRSTKNSTFVRVELAWHSRQERGAGGLGRFGNFGGPNGGKSYQNLRSTFLLVVVTQIDQNRSKKIKQMQLLSDNIDT